VATVARSRRDFRMNIGMDISIFVVAACPVAPLDPLLVPASAGAASAHTDRREATAKPFPLSATYCACAFFGVIAECINDRPDSWPSETAKSAFDHPDEEEKGPKEKNPREPVDGRAVIGYLPAQRIFVRRRRPNAAINYVCTFAGCRVGGPHSQSLDECASCNR
jgi:hypothetical protein